ncbi:MAG: SpoIIE family protein phosphatase [Bacteroidales bacterium]|nr:SpoIIE family protein phosphatase [Bacteroidales bacterium]
MIRRLSILFFILFSNIIILFSQNERLDSLLNEYNSSESENEILYAISQEYLHIRNYDKFLFYAGKGLENSKKDKNKHNELRFLYLFAEFHYLNSKYDNSLEYYNLIYTISDKIHDADFKGTAFQGFSKNYWRKGKFDEAVYFGTEAVKIFESIGDTLSTVITKGNLGIVYIDIGNYDRAEDIFDEILITYKLLNDVSGLANVYEKKGAIKFYKSYYAHARKFYLEAHKLYKSVDKELEASIELGNIGETYEMQNYYKKAIEYYKQAISTEKKYKYYSGLIFLYQALGRSYFKLNKYGKAKESYFISLNYINKIGEYRELPNIYKLLYELYEKTNDYRNAYGYSLKAMQAKDSISGAEVQNQINEIRIKYESEKKEEENELLRKNQTLNDKVINFQKKENKKQYLILISVLLLLVLITVILFFLYRLYRQNKRSGVALVNKNKQLNNLYKNITDNINYAENIQNALLSSFNEVTVHFSDYFIFYKPANVLSGDFYWSKKINDSIFIAVADSTGHGVPGALISILGMSYLNEIVIQDYIQTDTILNILRDKIKTSLNQKGEIGEQKDGLDISICSINIKSGEANFSGAFNSAYIISDSLHENPQEKHLIKLKADRQPVSVYHKESPFSKHKFNIKKGDIIYFFTDGFSDQLNESYGKKFMSKRFKSLLLSVSRENMKDQKKIIQETFLNWKGNFDQVDDVLVIGIEI